MKKIDPTVLKETFYIVKVSFILSILVQSIFLIIGKWDYTVLLGNLLGLVASVGNFFLMGLSVQAAISKDEKDAKSMMSVSQSMRLLLLFIAAIVGYIVPVFNIIAVVIPFIFPRISIALIPLFRKK